MAGTLHGRVVLIAGATGALGSAVTREFALTQARLALSGRSAEKLERLVGETGLPAGRVLAAAGDVTRLEGVEHLVSAVLECFGRLDVLLNAVGGQGRGKAESGRRRCSGGETVGVWLERLG